MGGCNKMIIKNDEAERKTIQDVARYMVSAARTAPKAMGIDNIETLIVDGKEKDKISHELKKISEETGADFYRRDGVNLMSSECLVLIGVRDLPGNLANCSYCGFKDCAETVKAGGRCALKITDLGIAIGSAVSVAANHRIDNRVFFSAGKAALRLGLFPDDVKICYGIPLSTHGKSIYHDRIQQEI